jgi:siroheme synthase-like protein
MPLPVQLDLTDRRCVIVGIGRVGTRKAKQFIAEGAEVIALSRSLPAERLDGVRYEQGIYERERVLAYEPWLVCAATNDLDTNAQIVTDCTEAGILTMDVSATERGDVKGLMSREKDGISFTVSTGVPLLSRMLVEQIETLITPGLVTFAAWQRALRPIAKDLIPHQPDRAALWRQVHQSEVLALLEAGEVVAARRRMAELVGEELAQHLP